MEQNFTLNQLVRYIYKELPPVEVLELFEEMHDQQDLERTHRDLLKSYRLLPKVTFSPSIKTLGKVLNYSCNTSLEAI